MVKISKFEVIDSDDSSDISSPDAPVDINSIKLGVRKVSQESFPFLKKSEKKSNQYQTRFLKL